MEIVMSVCKHVYGDVCMYAWECRCIYEYMGVHMMHLGIYVCTCICEWVGMCAYTFPSANYYYYFFI